MPNAKQPTICHQTLTKMYPEQPKEKKLEINNWHLSKSELLLSNTYHFHLPRTSQLEQNQVFLQA